MASVLAVDERLGTAETREKSEQDFGEVGAEFSTVLFGHDCFMWLALEIFFT